MAFKNPIPVAVALLRCGDGLLAIERANEPFIGGFAFPGGYINEGEDAEVAVSRELYEETGFFFDPNCWSPVLTHITPDNKLLIFMLCDEDLEESQLPEFKSHDGEATSAKIAHPQRDVLCFSLHQKALEALALWS